MTPIAAGVGGEQTSCDRSLFELSLFFAAPNLKGMFTAIECVGVDDRCDLLAAVSRTWKRVLSGKPDIQRLSQRLTA